MFEWELTVHIIKDGHKFEWELMKWKRNGNFTRNQFSFIRMILT